jgi:HAD superfamily hydrolase (TIGR01662 family)
MTPKHSLRGILFDFDQTLFDTSHLEEARRSKNWSLVESQLTTIKPFDGVEECLRKLKAKGYKIGVVTNSPRWIPEKVLHNHGITIDAIVGNGDTKYLKPHPEPFKKAAGLLNISTSRCAIVGDRCVDIAGGKAAGMETVGVEWYVPAKDTTDFQRDLLTALPKYLVASPVELTELLEELFDSQSNHLTEHYSNHTAKRLDGFLWAIEKTPHRRRHHLTKDDKYFYARWRYEGGYTASYANQLISNLKITRDKKNTARWKFKVDAINQFAHEAISILPPNSSILLIHGAKLGDHPEYDMRHEMLEAAFSAYGMKVIKPIKLRESKDSVHSVDDSSLRDPKTLEANLEWTGPIASDAKSIFILDDVITSGGHFKAYKNLINKYAPGIEVTGVFWTAQRNIGKGED